MDPNQNDLLRETYKLSQENNRMLHSMRRSAFIGGIFKFIFYVLVLVVAPLWLYVTYLEPIMKEFSNTMSAVRGTSSRAESQFESFESAWREFQSQFGSRQ